MLAARMRLLPAMLLALWLGGAAAQPYAADGGFARPTINDTGATTASVSVAVSPSGVITTVWGAAEGIWRQDRDATGISEDALLVGTNDVRAVSAEYVGDELVVSWVSRDRSTGVYHYNALLGGRQQELFTDALIVDLVLFDHQGSPYAAGLFRRGGEGQLRVIALADPADAARGGRVIYRTSLAQRGLDVLSTPDGHVWLGWVEGRNERGEFGLISEWNAFVAYLPDLDQPLLDPADLGLAYVEDERLRVALMTELPADSAEAARLPVATDLVHTLWADEEGILRVSTVKVDAAGLTATTSDHALGVGRPLGAIWPYFYWVTGTSIARASYAGGPATNVAWSPITIEGTGFSAVPTPVAAADPQPALTAIAWFGRAQGGAIQVYGTDTRSAMTVRWSDRLAAAMGWSPWHMWDELIGQALTALLIGVIAAIAMVPAFIVLGSLLGRLVRTPRRALLAGVAAALVLLVAGTTLYQRGFPSQEERTLIWLSVVAGSLLGALTGWLVGRSGDREAQGTFTIAGAVTMLVAATVLSFLTYRQWAALVGLS